MRSRIEHNFSLNQVETLNESFLVYDDIAQTIEHDFTGHTIRSQMRLDAFSTKAINLSPTIVGNLINITLSAALGLAIPIAQNNKSIDYSYDILITRADLSVYSFAKGIIKIYAGVSRV